MGLMSVHSCCQLVVRDIRHGGAKESTNGLAPDHRSLVDFVGLLADVQSGPMGPLAKSCPPLEAKIWKRFRAPIGPTAHLHTYDDHVNINITILITIPHHLHNIHDFYDIDLSYSKVHLAHITNASAYTTNDDHADISSSTLNTSTYTLITYFYQGIASSNTLHITCNQADCRKVPRHRELGALAIGPRPTQYRLRVDSSGGKKVPGHGELRAPTAQSRLHHHHDIHPAACDHANDTFAILTTTTSTSNPYDRYGTIPSRHQHTGLDPILRHCTIDYVVCRLHTWSFHPIASCSVCHDCDDYVIDVTDLLCCPSWFNLSCTFAAICPDWTLLLCIDLVPFDCVFEACSDLHDMTITSAPQLYYPICTYTTHLTRHEWQCWLTEGHVASMSVITRHHCSLQCCGLFHLPLATQNHVPMLCNGEQEHTYLPPCNTTYTACTKDTDSDTHLMMLTTITMIDETIKLAKKVPGHGELRAPASLIPVPIPLSLTFALAIDINNHGITIATITITTTNFTPQHGASWEKRGSWTNISASARCLPLPRSLSINRQFQHWVHVVCIQGHAGGTVPNFATPLPQQPPIHTSHACSTSVSIPASQYVGNMHDNAQFASSCVFWERTSWPTCFCYSF